ncbi:GNAT family N-acetyltransferase [Hoeflea sp.]|uniref:GNAT family N-acetyltransferase n=1 Tax=unclassified Hoeflea TaxID=2614931 RepID=UPI002AFFAF4A|nr:GNAT family N-acetyltransferase [Hoeflea sp.]
MITYRPISLDDHDAQPLSDEAWGDGYPFVERMLHDWKSGANRFDGPGERLIGAFDDDKLIGFCGLNRDPYLSENAGRIRHLYVSLSHRHRGIARALEARTLDGAEAWFPRIRLRATPQSRKFYERLGFVQVDEPEATHSKPLR